MQSSEPDVVEVLARLAAAAGVSATELVLMFVDLAAEVRAAVPSYLGMAVTIDGTAGPLTFAALGPAAPGEPPLVEASLDLVVTHRGMPERGPVTFTLYAGATAGFATLAAELSVAAPALAMEVTLDWHLGQLLPTSGGPDLDSAATIEQAVGVLIDQGLDPTRALAALRERPGPQATLLAAQEVLDSLALRPDPPGARAGPGG